MKLLLNFLTICVCSTTSTVGTCSYSSFCIWTDTSTPDASPGSFKLLRPDEYVKSGCFPGSFPRIFIRVNASTPDASELEQAGSFRAEYEPPLLDELLPYLLPSRPRAEPESLFCRHISAPPHFFLHILDNHLKRWPLKSR